MTVLEIVEQHLKDNGYDGLYADGVCSCRIGALMPYECPCDTCEPGYACDPPEGEDGEPGSWIGAEKAVKA